jgi:hypothetical protein
MWKWLRVRVAPRAFFCGFAIAFMICSYLGFSFSGLNHFKNFRRFHQPFAPYLRIEPTVSQMLSLVREPINQHKTLVIVGGNSIAFGLWQGKDLWSKRLEEELGQNYVVRNFAMEGMSAFSGGYLAFLSLAKKYQNVLYVTVLDPLCFYPIDKKPFGAPYYYDALYKNLLPFYPSIDKAVHERQSGLWMVNKLKSQEENYAGRLDSLFFFQDFWTAITYRTVFPDWISGELKNWLEKQHGYLDIEPPPDPLELRFTVFDDSQEKSRINKKWKNVFLSEKNGSFSLSTDGRAGLKKDLRGLVPEELSSRILVISVKDCPRYTKLLSAAERINYELLYDINSELLKEAGCQNVIIGSDFTENDYVDGCHLSPDGGFKMAHTVADQIKQMTQRSQMPIK